MNTLLSFLGFGWTKWETIEQNKLMIQESFNAIWGMVSRIPVRVDVQRRTNKLTGKIKYKNIVR